MEVLFCLTLGHSVPYLMHIDSIHLTSVKMSVYFIYVQRQTKLYIQVYVYMCLYVCMCMEECGSGKKEEIICSQICSWCQCCGIYQIEGFLGQTPENIQIALNHTQFTMFLFCSMHNIHIKYFISCRHAVAVVLIHIIVQCDLMLRQLCFWHNIIRS